MNKSLKAALLSGLLFPGAGQFWLRHRLRGVALMVAVSASLAVIVAKTAAQALAILEKLETEGGAIDLVAIVNSAQASSSSNFAIQCASLLLVAIWVISVVDAYALGKKQERAQQQPKTRL